MIVKQEMGWENKSSTLGAFEEAVQALEEVQQYRQIGTPEECRAAMTVKKEVQEIVDRQLVAGKNNYKETYDCFWEIVKVVQANY